MGNDTKSDARLFYNPSTKKLLASSDFHLNISGPSGPLFNLPYAEPTTYSLYNESVSTDAPTYDLAQDIYLAPTHISHPMQHGTIIDIPFSHTDPYTIQLKDDQTIIQAMQFDILPYNPSSLPTDDPSGPIISHPWYRHKAKATLYLSDTMTQPKHGIIVQTGSSWHFHPGHSLQPKSKSRRKPATPIPLPSETCELEQLLRTKQLSKGWQNSKTIKQHINAAKTFQIIARCVAFMHTLTPPSSLMSKSPLASKKLQNKMSSASVAKYLHLIYHHYMNRNSTSITNCCLVTKPFGTSPILKNIWD